MLCIFHCSSKRHNIAEGTWLCSAEELGRLRNPALAVAVERERLRLSRLHARLFRQSDGAKDSEPAVSLESFVWAHCLVRSRALELTAGLVRHSQIQGYWSVH